MASPLHRQNWPSLPPASGRGIVVATCRDNQQNRCRDSEHHAKSTVFQATTLQAALFWRMSPDALLQGHHAATSDKVVRP